MTLPSDLNGLIYERFEKSVEEVGYSIRLSLPQPVTSSPDVPLVRSRRNPGIRLMPLKLQGF